MAIEKDTEENKMTIRAGGRLDAVTSPELGEILQAIPADLTELVFDLSGLEYISSAGLRQLLVAQKQMNKQGKMYVEGAGGQVLEVFAASGFDKILTLR